MDWSHRIGRRLKPRDLHVFMAVAEHGTMAIAAERLAISPPVVSKTIADLEHVMGGRLFDRFPHGVELTPFGRTLARRGVVIFDELRRTVEELESLRDETSGEVRFACTEVLAAGLMPVVMDRVAHRFPKWTFNMQITSQDGYSEMLRSREVDLVISRNRSTHADFAGETLFYERLIVVAGANSHWARKPELTLRDLAEARWIQASREYEPDGPTFEAFQALGMDVPKITITAPSLNLRTSLLTMGDYVTMIPESGWMSSPARNFLKELPIKIPRWRLPISILTLKNRSLSPAAQVFAAEIRELAKTLVEERQSFDGT
jgi:DNA-binding transcriptional LysR family regulator